MLFILLCVKTHGQVSDTVFVYDTVVVPEIKIVYDTVKIAAATNVEKENLTETKRSESFFKKNNTSQNAVLAIDTATAKAELILFSKNDTATILINSILLSENLNNSDTMKKKILTLAASAMLAQASLAQSAQESKKITATGEESLPIYTIGIGGILASNTQNDGNLQGISMSINKVCTKKFLIGLNTDIGRLYEKGWNSSSVEGSAVYNNLNGIYTNLFASVAYYVVGTTQSKAAMYGRFGLGAVVYRTRQSLSFVGSLETITDERTSLNLSAQLCIGGDLKLGKGKLFVEIVSLPSLFEQGTFKETNPDTFILGAPFTRKSNANIGNNDYAQQFGMRIGYVLHF